MKIQHKIIGASIITGAFIWVIDAVLDFLFFQEGSFLEVLIYDVHSHHLYIRLVGIGSFLIFGIIIAKVMASRKKAEDDLKYAHSDLNQIFNAAVPLCVIDKSFRMMRVNDTFCSSFGLKREKIIGKKCYEIWKGPFCNTRECPMKLILSGMERSEHEVTKKLNDGRTISCIVTAIPYRSLTGELLGVVENFTDVTERKQAEEAMKIRDIALESSLNAVGFVALDGTIAYINNSWLKMWGYEHKKEVLGKDSLSFWLEKDKVLKVIQEVHTTGRWVGELLGVKKCGSTFDVQLSAHMAKNNEGKPICMMATFLDITERKKAEAELKNHRLNLEKMVNERTNELKTANQRLRKQAQIIDQIHDSVVSTDLDGYVTTWNKGAERIFGYLEKEALGKHISFVYPKEEHEFLDQKVIAPLKQKGIYNVEVRMRKKTGEEFYAHLSLSLHRNSMGEVVGMIGYSMDITDRKKAEEKLERFFNLSLDMFCIAGLDGYFKHINPRFEEILNYTTKELLERSFLDFIHPEDKAATIAEVEKLATGVPSIHFENRYRCKDGSYKWFAWTSFPVVRERLMYAVARDITERKRMEEELQKIERLEAIGVLAGGIAHDFNNLLTGIIGNLSLAELFVKKGDNLFETLTSAKMAAKQAGQLTHQLLTFSKGGAPIKELASILELIEETACFALRGSNVKCDCSKLDNPWTVEIDKGQISQVVSNLIINAHQAMPEGGTISISTENVTIGENDGLPLKKGKYIKISIKDQGIGIPKEYLKKIFDPYFTTKQEGSGLGLASCHSIVKNHGGHIMVESESGIGTTFYIYLPAVEKGIFTIKHIVEESPLSGEGRILFMDDEQNVINTAKRILIRV